MLEKEVEVGNPFNPGAGRKPPYLAGRGQVTSSVKADMQRVYDDSEGMRPVIVSGLRGMGKTVLLREVDDFARSQGWVAICVEPSKGDSLARKLAQAIYVELRRLRSAERLTGRAFEHALAVLRSFQLKIDPSGAYSFGIDIDPAKGYADSGDLSLDLGDLLGALGEAARDAGTAVLICIDELQEASIDDLRALNVALHNIGQGSAPVPVFFVGAGLPTLPAVLAEASTYAERMYRFYTLDTLEPEAAKAAYVEPVEEYGSRWEGDALNAAIEAAAGYPYFIQQCGFCICEQIEPPAAITVVEVAAGIELAREELARGLYRSRWDRATMKGKEFMRAMAIDDGASQLGDIAQRMGKKSANGLSVLRDRLIRDGLIYAPERGYVAFTVPGMADYIERAEEM